MNIAQIAQAKPEVLDLIDEDATVRVLSDAPGVPTKVASARLPTLNSYASSAQAQQAAQQQQAAMQMQQVAGEAMAKKAIGAA